MLVSTAFFLGLLLGGILLVVTLLYDKRTTTECPVCKQAKELQEKEEERLYKEWEEQQKEEERLYKEWEEQQKGYKN